MVDLADDARDEREPRTISSTRERRDWPSTMKVARFSRAKRRISSPMESPLELDGLARRARRARSNRRSTCRRAAAELAGRAHVHDPEPALEALARVGGRGARAWPRSGWGGRRRRSAPPWPTGASLSSTGDDALEARRPPPPPSCAGRARGARRGCSCLKKLASAPGILSEVVDDAAPQPVEQGVGGEVHEHDLVGPVEHDVRHGLLHADPGDLVHRVVQALDVLDVDRGDHVDAGGEDLLPRSASASRGSCPGRWCAPARRRAPSPDGGARSRRRCRAPRTPCRDTRGA